MPTSNEAKRPQVGDVLRIRYELTKELYEHPLFYAYEARDRVVGEDVCIRALKKEVCDQSQFVLSVKDTVEKISQLKTNNIERFIAFDQHDDIYFIVSELAEGILLSEKIKKNAPFSPQAALATILPICETIAELHEQKIILGDISSINIKINKAGVSSILLPGLADTYSTSTEVSYRMFPLLVRHYAPELQNGKVYSSASDQYCIGIILYELLTGTKPFSGDTPENLAEKHTKTPIPDIRKHNPVVPAALVDLTKRLLAKNPNQRYPDFKQLVSDLKKLNDALRFGKPIINDNRKQIKEDAKSVAPRMEALQQEDKKFRKKKRYNVEASDSIPKWLGALFYLGLSVIIIMIGSWIFFNVNSPNLVKVPNIVGLSLNEANLRLNDLKLGLKIRKREASEKFPEGTIIEVNPAPGSSARENAHLYVTVSAGKRYVIVPDLRGRTVSEARAILSTLNLDLDEPVRLVKHPSIKAGKIVTHIPEPRHKTERFSKVRLHVSGGPKEGDDINNQFKKHIYKLSVTLPVTEEKIKVRVDIIDEKGTKTIHEKLHRSLESFNVESPGYGESATFKIYFNNELIKTVEKKAPREMAQAPQPSLKKEEPSAQQTVNPQPQPEKTKAIKPRPIIAKKPETQQQPKKPIAAKVETPINNQSSEEEQTLDEILEDNMPKTITPAEETEEA